MKSFWARSLELIALVGVPFGLLAAPAGAGAVDLEAIRTYLRTHPNAGSEVSAPEVGQALYLHVDVRANGASAAVSAPVRILLDGRLYCFGVHSIRPEGTTVWCNALWAATAGAHTVRGEVDYDHGAE